MLDAVSLAVALNQYTCVLQADSAGDLHAGQAALSPLPSISRGLQATRTRRNWRPSSCHSRVWLSNVGDRFWGARYYMGQGSQATISKLQPIAQLQ